jgi:hypothetical protein
MHTNARAPRLHMHFLHTHRDTHTETETHTRTHRRTHSLPLASSPCAAEYQLAADKYADKCVNTSKNVVREMSLFYPIASDPVHFNATGHATNNPECDAFKRTLETDPDKVRLCRCVRACVAVGV